MVSTWCRHHNNKKSTLGRHSFAILLLLYIHNIINNSMRSQTKFYNIFLHFYNIFLHFYNINLHF